MQETLSKQSRLVLNGCARWCVELLHSLYSFLVLVPWSRQYWYACLQYYNRALYYSTFHCLWHFSYFETRNRDKSLPWSLCEQLVSIVIDITTGRQFSFPATLSRNRDCTSRAFDSSIYKCTFQTAPIIRRNSSGFPLRNFRFGFSRIVQLN